MIFVQSELFVSHKHSLHPQLAVLTWLISNHSLHCGNSYSVNHALQIVVVTSHFSVYLYQHFDERSLKNEIMGTTFPVPVPYNYKYINRLVTHTTLPFQTSCESAPKMLNSYLLDLNFLQLSSYCLMHYINVAYKLYKLTYLDKNWL